MFFKLKNSGIDFSKDEDFKKLKLSKEKEDIIQDFIVMPERDSFTIRENKLQKIKNKSNKYKHNNRTGIGHISDFNKMEDQQDKPKENEVKKNNNPNITQEMNNKNKNKTSCEKTIKEEDASKKENSEGNINTVYIRPKDEPKDNNGENSDNDGEDEGKPEDPVNENPPVPPPKCKLEDFANIPCDIIKEANKIIENKEEFSKKKEKKLKCEENDDLVKRYDNKELVEKLNKKEKEEKN